MGSWREHRQNWRKFLSSGSQEEGPNGCLTKQSSDFGKGWDGRVLPLVALAVELPPHARKENTCKLSRVLNGGVIGDLFNFISGNIYRLGIWGTPVRQVLHLPVALLVLVVAMMTRRDSWMEELWSSFSQWINCSSLLFGLFSSLLAILPKGLILPREGESESKRNSALTVCWALWWVLVIQGQYSPCLQGDHSPVGETDEKRVQFSVASGSWE